jgi:hypothetical protein
MTSREKFYNYYCTAERIEMQLCDDAGVLKFYEVSARELSADFLERIERIIQVQLPAMQSDHSKIGIEPK